MLRHATCIKQLINIRTKGSLTMLVCSVIDGIILMNNEDIHSRTKITDKNICIRNRRSDCTLQFLFLFK